METLPAGILRNHITFMVAQDGCADGGGELPYVVGGDTWAAIEFVSGFKNFSMNNFVAQATHKITVRYRPGVQLNWKIQMGTRSFNLLYADDVEGRHVRLDLYCVELNGGS